MTYCINSNCLQPRNPDDAVVCQSCGTPLILNERYRPLKLLGKGGFGKTFLALDEELPDRPYCVIKHLKPNFAQDNHIARDLFTREAKTLARLGNHPKLPKLLNYFETNWEFYLVQEFINGYTLQQEVLQKGPFNEKQAEQFLRELLTILDYVHSQQVIHRDIKPANIIRRKVDQALILIDFGVVKDQIKPTTASSASESEIFTTHAVGTLGYAPAEQFALRPVFASDIYALGMTTLFLLTGQDPKAFNYSLKTGRVLWQEHVQVSDALTHVLNRMVTVPLTQRYTSAAAVLDSLNQQQPHSEQKPLILVIEDDPSLQDTIVDILLYKGYQVLRAPNGQVGLQMAQEHLPALVLCDVMMPVLDGYGVILALQQDPDTAAIPFIFLTAQADMASLRKGMRLGADDYLMKPIVCEELLETVAACLKKRATLAKTYEQR